MRESGRFQGMEKRAAYVPPRDKDSLGVWRCGLPWYGVNALVTFQIEMEFI